MLATHINRLLTEAKQLGLVDLSYIANAVMSTDEVVNAMQQPQSSNKTAPRFARPASRAVGDALLGSKARQAT